MTNTHICLDCRTEQPDNPFGWCVSCTGEDVISLDSIRANGTI